jgi:hypothetical protein
VAVRVSNPNSPPAAALGHSQPPGTLVSKLQPPWACCWSRRGRGRPCRCRGRAVLAPRRCRGRAAQSGWPPLRRELHRPSEPVPRAVEAGRRAGRACCRSGPAAAPGQPRAAGARQGAARGACTRGRASVLPRRAREPPHRAHPRAGEPVQRRRRGGERERSRTSSSSDGLAVADHDPGASGRGERWCASRHTTLLPLGLKSVDGETVPDGPSSGVGVGSRCCTPSPRTKAILSSSEEEEVASTATVAVDVDAIWPTGRPRGPVDFRAVSRVRARGRAGEVT